MYFDDLLARALDRAPVVLPRRWSRFEPPAQSFGETLVAERPAAPAIDDAGELASPPGSDRAAPQQTPRARPRQRSSAERNDRAGEADRPETPRMKRVGEAAQPTATPPATLALSPTTPTLPAAAEPGSPAHARAARADDERDHAGVVRADRGGHGATRTADLEARILALQRTMEPRANRGGDKPARAAMRAAPVATPQAQRPGPSKGPLSPPGASMARPSPRIAAPRSGQPAEPTVHVSIGRIEVRTTADRPTVPPRRAPGPRLGLEEYLKRRREG